MWMLYFKHESGSVERFERSLQVFEAKISPAFTRTPDAIDRMRLEAASRQWSLPAHGWR